MTGGYKNGVVAETASAYLVVGDGALADALEVVYLALPDKANDCFVVCRPVGSVLELEEDLMEIEVVVADAAIVGAVDTGRTAEGIDTKTAIVGKDIETAELIDFVGFGMCVLLERVPGFFDVAKEANIREGKELNVLDECFDFVDFAAIVGGDNELEHRVLYK
jgi:hypothetical protein